MFLDFHLIKLKINPGNEGKVIHKILLIRLMYFFSKKNGKFFGYF
jgi:hypothetical protein